MSLYCVETPEVVQVRIKQSKTEPFRNGVMVYLGSSGVSVFGGERKWPQVHFSCLGVVSHSLSREGFVREIVQIETGWS